MVGHEGVTVDRHAVDRRDLFHEPSRKRGLMRRNRLDARLRDEVERRGEAGDAVTVVRSRLETRGIGRRLLVREGAHARSTDLPGADVDALAHADAAGPLRTVEPLVTGEAEDVDAESGHVERHAPSRLRGVHDEKQAVLVGERGNAPQVNDIARDI